MPLYEYQCQVCGERTEILQRFSDHPVTPSADGTRLFGNDGAVFCR